MFDIVKTLKTSRLLFLTILLLAISFNAFAGDKQSDISVYYLINSTREYINNVKKSIKNSGISDNELMVYRYKLKEMSQTISLKSDTYASSITRNEKLLNDLNSFGLKDIKDNDSILDKNFFSKIEGMKDRLNTDKLFLLQLKYMENEVNETVLLVSDMQVDLRNKDLFIYNTPLYKGSAWISGSLSLFSLFLPKNIFSEKYFPLDFKLSTITPGFILLMILIIAVAVFLKLYSHQISDLMLKENSKEYSIIHEYKNIFFSKQSVALFIFVKNGIIPSLIIIWLEQTIIYSISFPLISRWIELLNNLASTVIYLFLFCSIIHIIFEEKLSLVPSSILNNNMRRRFYALAISMAVLFFINKIDISDISTSINPILPTSSVSILSFIIGLMIFHNGFIISLRIKKLLSGLKGFKKYFSIFINNIFFVIEFAIPILVFFGAVNFSVGLTLNINQCFLVVFILILFLKLINSIHPIATKHLIAYFTNASNKNDTDEKELYDTVETPLLTYWINAIILTLFCLLIIVLFLLIWGVPPTLVYDWVEALFFKGVPLNEHTTFSLIYLIRAVITGLASFYIFKGINRIIEYKVLPYTTMDSGTKHAIITAVGYLGVIISIILFIYALGINMTTLTFIISGLSIGIGFALQELFKNFFSGFVLLIERPIKVGDILSINNQSGVVQKIKMRATEVLTLTNDTLIIPNSELVNSTVVNETRDAKTRVDITVGVAYKSDPNHVINVLQEIVKKCDDLYKRPEPSIEFSTFSDSSIDFVVRVYTKRLLKFKVASVLRTLILLEFRKEGIEIPFPQRDITIRHQEKL